MMKKRQPGNHINHADVHSSIMRSAGYDAEKREMHVNFHDTGRYVYHNVPQDVYESFMMAGSKGNFLHNNVKNQYKFTKL